MANEVLVRVEGASKKFCKSLKRSMLYGVQDITRDIFNAVPPKQLLRKDEFWAVDDVSFEIRRGECLGLIGRNGAGKSTLLKMISGIILPDKGSVEIHGQIGALVELGAGFHPMLTGRENIYINGAIMGLSKKEIDEEFDSIVEFAELGGFIDTPVSYYSSGMYVRLGFAVAAHLEPDVLLIDEVLAVGDVGFRSKCYKKISALTKQCAVIFVSHSMSFVARLCNNTIVLNQGDDIFSGNTTEGIAIYNELFDEHKESILGTGEAEITDLRILDKYGNDSTEFRSNDLMQIIFDVNISKKYEEFLISVTFMSQEINSVAQCHSKYNNFILRNDGNKKSIMIEIDNLILNPGKYYLNIIAFDKDNTLHLAWHYAARKITVVGDFHGGAPVQFSPKWKVID